MTPALNGKTISLRALEPEDLDFLYRIENDVALWQVSNTTAPYSRFLLKTYLENAHLDIYQAKQLRLAIVQNSDNQLVGLIDLFDFEPQHRRAGVGIVIDSIARRNGYASEALALVIGYCFQTLHLHQLYCNISTENNSSVKLFSKFGFVKTGLKKDWNFTNNRFEDEAFFQLINQNSFLER